MQNHVPRNGDSGRRLLVKMDIEGAEWKSILATPDEILDTFDQLPMELHGTSDPLFLEAVEKLKRNFYLVHLHFNNWACRPELAPVCRRRLSGAVREQTRRHPRDAGVGQMDPGRAFDAPDNPKGPTANCRRRRSKKGESFATCIARC